MNESNKSNCHSTLLKSSTPFGSMHFFSQDDPIGRSIESYGEWARIEIDFLRQFIQAGSIVVDVGANIGTHTIAMAQQVGKQGHVHCFEPQPDVFRVLEANVQENNLTQVSTHQAGAGESPGELYCKPINPLQKANIGATRLTQQETINDLCVQILPLDQLELAECNLIKIDAEGMEDQIIRGTRKTLNRCRPILFIECNDIQSGIQIISELRNHSYSLFLVGTPAFNPQNHKCNPNNLFGFASESNLLCLPAEKCTTIKIHNSGCQVTPIHSIDEYAHAHLALPRYGDASAHERNPELLRQEIFELREQVDRLTFRARRMERLLDIQQAHQTRRNQYQNNHQQATPPSHTQENDWVTVIRSLRGPCTTRIAWKVIRRGLSLLFAATIREPIRTLRRRRKSVT